MKLKLAADTIRALIDEFSKPVSEQNHVERAELIKAAEGVLNGLRE